MTPSRLLRVYRALSVGVFSASVDRSASRESTSACVCSAHVGSRNRVRSGVFQEIVAWGVQVHAGAPLAGGSAV